MNKENLEGIMEKIFSVPEKNPFLEGNERIVTVISSYFSNPCDEGLLEVVETLRNRMNENGQLFIPVVRENGATEKGILFRTLELKENSHWLPIFTSKEETEKGPASEFLPYFIYQALQNCLKSDLDGLVINPWGESIVLSKDLLRMLFEANDEDPKAVVGKKLKRKDLEDGTLLKDAVQKFNEKNTMPFFGILLQLLRDSYVCVPCTAVLGEQDQASLEKMVQNLKAVDDKESFKGQKFINTEDVHFIPDILKDGEKYYFPIFTSVDEMGEYGEHFSKVTEHVLNILPLAENHEKNICGVIINPFTSACVIDKEWFGTIKEMKSMIGG